MEPRKNGTERPDAEVPKRRSNRRAGRCAIVVAAAATMVASAASVASAADTVAAAPRTTIGTATTLAPLRLFAMCNGKVATIVGAGTIYGTDGDDVIVATAVGDDFVYAGEGNDTVCAGWHGMTNEKLTVLGDAGNDWMQGGPGNDVLIGGPGGDTILGGGGDDQLEGGAGRDLFDGESGSDTVVYRNAPGWVTVDLALREVPGPFGATTKRQTASGADERDFFNNVENATGSDFGDSLYGDENANVLRGDGGDDFVRGNGGNDVIDAEFGSDDIDGGWGVDTVSYKRSSQVVVDLQNDSASAVTSGKNESDAVTNVENAIGTPGNDTLIGDGWENELRGGDGADTLRGLSGNDKLFGGAGSDSYDGGSDIDLCLTAGEDAGDSYIRCETGMAK